MLLCQWKNIATWSTSSPIGQRHNQNRYSKTVTKIIQGAANQSHWYCMHGGVGEGTLTKELRENYKYRHMLLRLQLVTNIWAAFMEHIVVTDEMKGTEIFVFESAHNLVSDKKWLLLKKSWLVSFGVDIKESPTNAMKNKWRCQEERSNMFTCIKM